MLKINPTNILFGFLTLILLVCEAKAQPTSYRTQRIANWTLENFPTQYMVKAHHAITQRDRMSGKIMLYNEVDENGNSNGITVEMQQNLLFPYLISYTYKGQMVYRASYFSNSNRPYQIVNRDLDGLYNGPNIDRTVNDDQTVSEKKIIYSHGKDINHKTPENIAKFNSNGYLEGDFLLTIDDPTAISSYNRTYKGNATNGLINYYECTRKDGSYSKAVMNKDTTYTYYEVSPQSLNDTAKSVEPIFRMFWVTNSQTIKQQNRKTFLFDSRSNQYFDPEEIFRLMRNNYIDYYDSEPSHN